MLILNFTLAYTEFTYQVAYIFNFSVVVVGDRMGTVVCLPEHVARICGESADWLAVHASPRRIPRPSPGMVIS